VIKYILKRRRGYKEGLITDL